MHFTSVVPAGWAAFLAIAKVTLVSCICTSRKRIFKIRRCPSFSRNASVRFPTERRVAQEPELPGAPAVGTSQGHLSHITAKSKKLPENGVNYCLPKIVMMGEETQSWARPPYASSHRTVREAYFHVIDSRFFFSSGRDVCIQPICLPFVCSIVYYPKEQQIYFRFAQRWRQSSFPLSLD